MNSTTYTPQQCSDVVQLYAAVQSNPPDRQTIIILIWKAGWRRSAPPARKPPPH